MAQLVHPGVLHLGENKGARATLSCNVEALIIDTCLSKGFAFGANEVYQGIGDCRVVRGKDGGLDKREAVLRKVLRVTVNEANEVLFPPGHQIVEDIEEDGINHLHQRVEVGIGRLADDRGENFGGFREECGNVLRRHRWWQRFCVT